MLEFESVAKKTNEKRQKRKKRKKQLHPHVNLEMRDRKKEGTSKINGANYLVLIAISKIYTQQQRKNMYLILSLEFCFSISMLLLLFFLVFILNVKAASGVFVQHLAFGFCYYCSRKKRKKKCVGCLVLRINRNDIQYLNVLYCKIYHIQNSKASSSFVRKSVAFIIIHIKHILYANIFFIFPLFLRVLSCAVHSLYVHSGLLFIFFL